MKKLKSIRQQFMWRLEYGLAKAFFLFLRIQPFKFMRWWGSLLGKLLFLVPSQRKLIMANLKVAFPDLSEKEARNIGRQSLSGMILVFCEMIWFYGDAEKFSKYLTIPEDIKKRVLELNRNDRPTLFLPMHWGNWEVSTISLKILAPDDPVTIIAKKQRNPYLDALVMEGRRKSGFEFVDSSGAVRALVKALKKGGSVGLLVDQNTKIKKGGTFGQFFGLPVTISKSAAMMASKFNTNVYVYACRRTKSGFEVYTNELQKEPKDYENQDDLSQAILDLMEGTVRAYPDQWVWLYKRWLKYPKNFSDQKENYPYYASMSGEEYHPEEV